MQKLRDDMLTLQAAAQAQSARLEAVGISSSGLGQQLRETGQNLQHMEATVTGQSRVRS